MNKNSLLESANQIFDEIVEIRRDIHRHPELGRTEVRTSGIIREKLAAYGVDEIQSPVPTAVIGLIHGKKGTGKTVGLRADIDALPVVENTGLPFASENEGIMHACGHDMHVSMLLGVAKLLCERRDDFAGTVKLIFQHSEDTLPGGAKELVEKGVMDDVDAIFGMHVLPDEDRVGKIGFQAGPLTTSVDLFDFEIIGKGGHGSAPHTAIDPILAGCQLVVGLQQIPARNVDPLETVILPVNTFHSGEAVNVIPNEAKLTSVARCYKQEIREQVQKRVFEIVHGVEAMTGCTINVDHYEGYPAAYNDLKLTPAVQAAMAQAIGVDRIVDMGGPMSFSEDFSYYTQLTGKPGVYVMLYAGHEGDELVALHNPKCAMKEEAMPYGMAAMTSAAMAFLAE